MHKYIVNMKVLIINTSERTGGAAVAAGRLMDALNNNGVKAKMLVRDKESDRITVVGVNRPWFKKWHFLWERLCIFARLHFKRENLFAIDTGGSGIDITKTPEFREADVVHLHWINQGMLSLKGIRKILKSGKPVVWTMHDLWPATALCHYNRGCHHYKTHCQQCLLLPNGGHAVDLSTRVWRRKSAILREGSIFFVTCSRWLEGEAKSSGLLQGHHITSIPNAIDTRIYHRTDQVEARRRTEIPQKKNVILFVSQRVTDERKGIAFFIEALQQLVRQHPQLAEDSCVAILGSHTEEVVSQLPLSVHVLGYVSDEKSIVDIYNSADVFVTPSLEDNLPNTIMEALACGTPCVGFRVGGIPEMIDHKRNGYVAAYRDAADLANGIHWTLCEANRDSLSREAVRKVMLSYSQSSVSVRYSEIYQQAIAQKHLKL